MSKIKYGLYRAKYLLSRNLPLKAPVDVSMELSSRCNMRCVYCYHADQDKLPFGIGFLSFDRARAIIDSAAACGVSSLKFNWRGESTLNPDFAKILKYAKDKGCFIDRLTNSNFKFSTKRYDIFEGLCCQTKVKVSYDSTVKWVFEDQRAGGNWDLTTKNIDTFYNHPDRKNTELVIQAVRTNLNKDEDIAGEVRKRWPGVKLSIRDMVEGRIDADLDELTHKKRDLKNRVPCYQAFARLIFDHNGDCHMCCPDIKGEINLGNIDDHTVYSLFNSEKAKQIRASLKDKSAFKSNPCLTCSSFESYKGYKPAWKS